MLLMRKNLTVQEKQRVYYLCITDGKHTKQQTISLYCFLKSCGKSVFRGNIRLRGVIGW